MKIKKIEVNWWHGYGNAPTLDVHVDKRIPHNEFIYEMFTTGEGISSSDHLDSAQSAIVRGLSQARKLDSPTKVDDPDPEYRGPCYLLSQNNWPWVRFVAIVDPDGSPTMNGGLSGEYRLTNGRTYHTRTGWSSSASQCNSRYGKFLESEITEVTLFGSNERTGWAGYNISVEALDWLYQNAPDIWPTALDSNGDKVKVEMVRTSGGHWTPSIDKYTIVKAGYKA